MSNTVKPPKIKNIIELVYIKHELLARFTISFQSFNPIPWTSVSPGKCQTALKLD